MHNKSTSKPRSSKPQKQQKKVTKPTTTTTTATATSGRQLYTATPPRTCQKATSLVQQSQQSQQQQHNGILIKKQLPKKPTPTHLPTAPLAPHLRFSTQLAPHRRFSTQQPATQQQQQQQQHNDDVEEISLLERRKRAFMPTEAPQAYLEAAELGTEYLDEPADERDPALHKNLNSLLNTNFNFGFKSYSEVIHDKSDSKVRIPMSGPNMISTVHIEQKLQAEQSMEDALARVAMTKIARELDNDFEQRDQNDRIAAQRRLEEEKELEEYATRRSALTPIRNAIPAEIKQLSKTLVLEAQHRQLDEHGDRPNNTEYQSLEVMDENGAVHDSKQTVMIDGVEFILADMQDKHIVSEIIKISMDWNRSGVRNKPLQSTDLQYSNKAKLEDGVSPYFSANKETSGRGFTYHKFISDVERAVTEAGHAAKPHLANHKSSIDAHLPFKSINDPHTTDPNSKPLSYAEQFPTRAPFAPLMSLDFEKEDAEEVYDNNLIGTTLNSSKPVLPPLPSLPHGIAMPTSLGLMKADSPYKELHPDKPKVSLNDKIASNSQELANQLIHRDFLHNSIIRRKPRGKLTELELRDALVDAERAHQHSVIFDHYEISMLSLFEETGNSQSIAKASDVIGGFAPVYLRVKTDFDPTFIKMVSLLHEQQKLSDEAEALEDDTNKTTFFGISNELEELEKAQKKEKKVKKASNEDEKKHLEFLARLMKTDSDGYSTLHKDDVLIPNFPDSVIEMILSETLDKQIDAKKTVDSNEVQHTPNKNKVKSNLRVVDSDDEDNGPSTAQRVDSTMRDSMMNEILIFKGRTIGELHQMGCFNRNPYDDVNQEEYTPGAARNDFEDGGQRNRYAFTDDMKHMHRFMNDNEAQAHKTAIYGGKSSQDAQEKYMSRLEKRNDRFKAAAQRKNIPLMTETSSFIEPILPEDKREFSAFYDEKRPAPSTDPIALSKISRFAQLAMASTVISKYGGLDSAYRQATGITMKKIDDLIIDALEQGDVPIKQLPEAERDQYLSKLKADAIEYPKMAFAAMAEQLHVPYMTTGLFGKIPSRYFGAWDYETALNGPHLHQMGIQNSQLERLGPYHPMFLVAVGGRGFTQEGMFTTDDLRAMLRGDVDERPEVQARRTAQWMKKHPSLDPKVIKPFMARDTFVPVSAEHRSRRHDPLEHITADNYGNDNLEQTFFEEQDNLINSGRPAPYTHYIDENGHPQQQKQQHHQTQQQQQHQQHQADQNLQSHADRAAAHALASQQRAKQLNEIPEIADDEDEAEFDNKYTTQQSLKEQEQQYDAQGPTSSDKPGQSRPQLPRQYPQLHDVVESFDPNEITFNTGSMTEFHKTHEVNEYDLKETSEKLLAEAELTYKTAKQRERDAAMEDGDDVSHKAKLRYFVDHDYQQDKAGRIQREIDGDYSATIKTTHADANIVTLEGDSRTKPNPFAPNAAPQFKIDTKNPQHELYGGPITVQHFLSSMINTDEGRDIAHGIELEHRDFLGDDVYEEAIKNSPVNKPLILKKPAPSAAAAAASQQQQQPLSNNNGIKM